MKSRRAPTTALTMIFLAPIIWGTTFSILKRMVAPAIGLPLSSPIMFAVLRSIIAVGVFLSISPAARAGFRYVLRPKNALERRFRFDMLVLGLTLAAGTVFQNVGLLTTTTSKSAFLTSTTIIWTPIFCLFTGQERLTIRLVAAIAVTLIGMFLMTHPAGGGGLVIGDLLTALCAVSFGVYIAWMDQALPRTMALVKSELDGAMLIGGMNIAISGLAMIILMPLAETPHFAFAGISVAAVIYTALFATVITGFIQARYQNAVPPTVASIIFMLEPVVAMLVSLIVLHEPMGTEEALGALFIVGGVMIAQFGGASEYTAMNPSVATVVSETFEHHEKEG